MNQAKKLSRKMEDDIFNEQSPLLEDFVTHEMFGETMEKDPRRATACRKVREVIDDFLREKHYVLKTGYFIIDKELFIEHINDTIHISIKDTPANLAATSVTVATGAPVGTGAVINTVVNTKETLDFFKAHRSELENRLNEKIKSFKIVVEHDFVNYLTITMTEKRIRI